MQNLLAEPTEGRLYTLLLLGMGLCSAMHVRPELLLVDAGYLFKTGEGIFDIL